MALKIETTNRYSDVPMSNAYHRVINFASNVMNQTMEITIGIWVDASSRQNGKDPIDFKTVSINPHGSPEVRDENGNVIQPAVPSFAELVGASNPGGATAFAAMQGAIYTFLKGMSTYADAEDV